LLRIDHEHNLDKILECKRIVEVAQLHLVCFDEIVLIALEKVVPVVVGWLDGWFDLEDEGAEDGCELVLEMGDEGGVFVNVDNGGEQRLDD
jgi:hypothetical protein